MRKEHWVLGFLTILVLILTVVSPRTGWTVRSFLVGSGNSSSENQADLRAENESLRAEVAKLEDVKRELKEWSPHYLPAVVYSRYPFNFKNEFLIGAGQAQGVTTGKAVVFQGIFVGYVEQVFAETALVQTVFDDRMQLPVRIGPQGVDALLRGGSEPRLTLIEKRAAVTPGDIIYSAASRVPYGVPVGDVADVRVSADQLFQEATVKFPYDLNAVHTVLVLVDDEH